MKQWFLNLEKREQRIVSIGAPLLLVFLIYSFGWQPISESVELLKTQTQSQTQTLQWMRKAAVEVKQLRGNTTQRARIPAGQSLLAVIDKTTQTAQLGKAVKRIQPKGKNGVQIRLEQAAFDNMIDWLNKLKTQQGISITTISIERLDTPGLVNARISLASSV
ncbi:MAG TPA: type II secretion system protein M [Chromatiaceae bacterium]|jgi:general secretion pathway protein M|nr:type II secretion system protein M [Chromatiaceae bacterium]HIA07583.1 type II secretion system protein M [Chromatiaceae bacterium]HIN82772.1 type II secretion system protein M [Chromatiales bacterium]